VRIKYSSVWPLAVTLFCACLFKVEMIFLITLVALLLMLLSSKGRLSARIFNGKYIYYYFIAMGFILAICYAPVYDYSMNHIVKDAVYLTLPLLFWLVGSNGVSGYWLREKSIQETKSYLYTTVFYVGLIYSFYDIIIVCYRVLMFGITEFSIQGLRSVIGTGTALPIICFFLSIYVSEFINIRPVWKKVGNILFIVDALIHFSRMNILLIVVLISFSGIIKKPKKMLKYGAAMLFALVVVYLVLPEFLLAFVDKILYSITEISFSQSNWDMTSIVHNWRGYEAFCEIQKFSKLSSFEQLFGSGFGSQLELGGYAYLVTSENTIPFLHNGYFTILMKWGIVGVVAYIVMLICMFRTKITYKKERNFYRAIVIIIAVDTLFVHGLFFSPAVASLMLLNAIIYKTNRGV
jgi:hypothetical protein